MTPLFTDSHVTIHHGDAWDLAPTLEPQSVQTIVTSPPYWGLRDYGVEGQFGLEATFAEHVERLVELFRLLRPALRDDGTVWLNYGDRYVATGKGWGDAKPKDLLLMPPQVALALRADGWYLRQEIIWHKTNPMPETVYDRPTRTHEHIYLLSKSATYYYDHAAIAEKATGAHARRAVVPDSWIVGGGAHDTLTHSRRERDPGVGPKSTRPGTGVKANESFHASTVDLTETRNKRSVWTLPVGRMTGAHFATFPPDLIRPCVLAGCPEGGVVLDPFMGSGTTAVVARSLGRKAIGFELNADYIAMAAKRLAQGVLALEGVEGL